MNVLPSETNCNVHNYRVVDRRKAFSLITRRDHSQKFSSSQISHMPQVGFELADNLPLSYFESRFSVVIATTPRSHLLNKVQK